MDKKTMTAADMLKDLKSKEAVLKKQVAIDKIEAKQKRAKDLIHRNEVLAKTTETINKVQKEIFAYKRLGKSEKMNYSIKEKICSICDPYYNADAAESHQAKAVSEPQPESIQEDTNCKICDGNGCDACDATKLS